MSEIWTLVWISDSAEIQTKPVQISALSDFGHLGFLGHTNRSDFSMFGFQAVSEIRTFERVPLAFKWLATGFFGFGLTFSLTE